MSSDENLKAVILAGGRGTRLGEETTLRPKPMVEIGGMPILWHIMKIYSAHGITDFVICLGYKGYVIKEYFANYILHTSDVTFDLKNNQMEVRQANTEPWNVTLVDTGVNTMTGGRVKKIQKHVDGSFCLTYGDGVSDIDVKSLIQFHEKNNFKGTVTAVQPPGKFGSLQLDGNVVTKFTEKPSGDLAWINGGFCVFEPEIFDYIKDSTTVLEKYPLEKLADLGQLGSYKHTGFWKPVDTIRDKEELEKLWNSGSPPWKIW